MTLIKNYFDPYHPRYFVAKILFDGDKLKLIEHSITLAHLRAHLPPKAQQARRSSPCQKYLS